MELLLFTGLLTLAFLIEAFIEIPTTFRPDGRDVPTWAKPLMAFLLGLFLSYAFGISLAQAAGLSFADYVPAEAAKWIDSVLVGLAMTRGSGWINKLLNR